MLEAVDAEIVQIPRQAIAAAVAVYASMHGLLTDDVLANAMARAIAEEMIKAGRIEVWKTAAPWCTWNGLCGAPQRMPTMERVGATPREVFGSDPWVRQPDVDRAYPLDRSYRAPINLPFAPPQPLLKDIQADIEDLVSGRGRRLCKPQTEQSMTTPDEQR